ncbi:MAG: arginine N-succinyltransferase [Desulfuromonadales bacterium]
MDSELQRPAANQPLTTPQKGPQNSGLKILGIIILASVISTLVAFGVLYFYLFQSSFRPVTLSASEEQALESKLERLDDNLQRSPALHKARLQPGQSDNMQPERYSENDANREIVFTERELNALLAKNTDLATKLAIDLSQDLASAKLLIPLDEDLPVFGGKTLKVTAGLALAYRNKKPVVALRGISVWGVPIPNAWLGNMKNVDLVREFGNQKGFWKAFADGIEEVEVSDGRLRVKLKE